MQTTIRSTLANIQGVAQCTLNGYPRRFVAPRSEQVGPLRSTVLCADVHLFGLTVLLRFAELLVDCVHVVQVVMRM
jgi:hypothetical protein